MSDSKYKLAVGWEQFLRESAVSREAVDDFLERPQWAHFDAELGYVLHGSLIGWGIEDSRTIETVDVNGARSRVAYADKRPRINTYGDSFTECNQVSDAETWQEYLAGHFGEPIGNYGVGGFGLYQAYRRMLRDEQSDHGAECLVLYIWGDDSVRSLMRARWTACYRRQYALAGHNRNRFHGNPWVHVEMDLSSGRFVEKDNPLSTPESLYSMCDPDWMVDFLRGDLSIHLLAYWMGQLVELDRDLVDQLAAVLGVEFDWPAEGVSQEQAAQLLRLYSQRATNFILDKARAFAEAQNKRLLVVLNWTSRHELEYSSEYSPPPSSQRYDQEVLNHLVEGNFDYFDMNAVHELDFARSSHRSFRSYLRQFQIDPDRGTGHYSPRGNLFFAYSIKDKLREMLNPPPLPYQ